MKGYENDPTWELDHGLAPKSRPEVINYRGAIIEPGVFFGYSLNHPGYSDGGHGKTLDDCLDEIDQLYG